MAKNQRALWPKKSKSISSLRDAARHEKISSEKNQKDRNELQAQSEKLKSTVKRIEKTAVEMHKTIGQSHGGAHLAHIQATKGTQDGESKVITKFPIVGIGASAGGLEAVTQLLKHMPADIGMAFVLVQHLDPTHESALSSLLTRATEMPVTEARENVRLEPNQVYIIPPNKSIVISARHLKLSPRKGQGREEHMPIDRFFCSLAEEEGNNAIAIILSGSGADGTQGLLAIHAAGGVTFAQEEKTAKYPAMPGSAINSGGVDFVLSPERMVRELKRIGGHLSMALPEEQMKEEQPSEDKAFEEILPLLRQRSGVDFTYYKHATLHSGRHWAAHHRHRAAAGHPEAGQGGAGGFRFTDAQRH
jgi:chemotaxis response regulator CheB